MYKVFFNHRWIEFADKAYKPAKLEDGCYYYLNDSAELSRILKFFYTTTSVLKLTIFSENPAETFKFFNFHFMLIAAAGGFIVNEKGEILLIYRFGKWDLPKGKAEKGEIPSETAIREVQEECGIHNLTIGSTLGETYHTYKMHGIPAIKKTVWFLMQFSGNEVPTPQLEEDIQEVRWVSPADIDQYLANTYDSLVEIIQQGVGIAIERH
jgi:ADP-ribose pyrophosphatase